jgi:hypothetical protein
MVNRKLELVFIDKDGKWYPTDEVNSDELAEGFEKISEEIVQRLQLKKEQRQSILSPVSVSRKRGDPSCVRRYSG